MRLASSFHCMLLAAVSCVAALPAGASAAEVSVELVAEDGTLDRSTTPGNLSADGRYVAFEDTGGQVRVRDTASGTTELI